MEDVPRSCLNLLLVSKQVYREGVEVFYKHNKFVFYHPLQLSACLFTLKADRKAYIKNISLWFRPASYVGSLSQWNLALEQMVRDLPQLKSFEIVLDWNIAYSCCCTPKPRDLPGKEYLDQLRRKEKLQLTLRCPEADFIIWDIANGMLHQDWYDGRIKINRWCQEFPKTLLGIEK
ncbi:hypothetical protein P280DRAFT_467839, partial [Massarina eburnea CBS 473.64]